MFELGELFNEDNCHYKIVASIFIQDDQLMIKINTIGFTQKSAEKIF